jgi:hypothetical protein
MTCPRCNEFVRILFINQKKLILSQNWSFYIAIPAPKLNDKMQAEVLLLFGLKFNTIYVVVEANILSPALQYMNQNRHHKSFSHCNF